MRADELDWNRPEAVIWMWASLEWTLTLLIATRVARPDAIQLFMEFVVDRIPVDAKIDMAKRIIERGDAVPQNYYPEFAADLKEINQFRVHLAHGVFAPSDNGETIGFWKVKRATHTFMSSEDAAMQAPKIRSKFTRTFEVLQEVMADELESSESLVIGLSRDAAKAAEPKRGPKQS
jgi:hypothetical protein